nr:PREDICTED: phosphotriesterase-related protein-like [Linepithema humile]
MTGVNVIVGSVVADSPKSQNSFQEHIYNELKRSLIEGNRFFTVDESPIIKSAFIGETPCYNYDEAMAMQLTENEKIFLSMTGQVQNELHCPVTLYPANNSSLPEEIMRIYQEAGGDSSKAIMSHVDLAFSKKQKFMEFVDDTNCYLEFSLFGNPSSLEIGNDILSDAQRIKRIKRLKEEGKLNRVLMSHDIHTKNRLVSYGGLGLGHISKISCHLC